MATFGKTAIGGTNASRGGDTATACRFTLSENGTVSQMSWYGARSAGNANMAVAIYSDSGGNPNALLATSSAVAINSATPQWWNFTISVALSTGDYHLVFLTDASVEMYYDTVSGLSDVDNTGVTYPTFPEPFSVDATQDREVSIYATYTTGSPSASASNSLSPSASLSPSSSESKSESKSQSSSASLSPSGSISPSISPSASESKSVSKSASNSPSPSVSLSESPSVSASPSPASYVSKYSTQGSTYTAKYSSSSSTFIDKYRKWEDLP